MNYFEEYERLKETKQLIPIGSIWTNERWNVQIIEVTSASVYFIFYNITSSYIFFNITSSYNKRTFLENFTRVE